MLRTRRPHERKGAAAVEFALVAPIFILLVLASIEFGRGMMVQQVLTNASRHGAREAALQGSTADTVRTAVTEFLAMSSIDKSAANVSVSPDPTSAAYNDSITVTVEVPYDRIAWIPGSYLKGRNLTAACTMRSERLE